MYKNVLSGQIGLVLLVIMGVVVALVMSVASRSLSDTVLSRQERESSAAFSVAETGIENAMNALRNGTIPEVTQFSDSTGLISGQFGVRQSSRYAMFVKEGETAHLDLTGLSGPLTIEWTRTVDSSENRTCSGEGSGNAPAGLEIMTIQGTGESAQFAYFNPYGCGAVSSNGFEDSLIGDDPYRSKIEITPSASSTTMRIKPIYSGATIEASGIGLTNQLYLIQSKAEGGDARKEIEVKRGLDAPPSIFDFAVFSAGTIVK